MSPPNKIHKTDDGEIERNPDGVIRFEVENISSLGACDVSEFVGRYSPEIEVGGVTWCANVWNSDFLGVCLYCMTNQASPWSIDADVEYTLVNSNSRKNQIKKKSQRFRNNDRYSCCISLNWDNVIDYNEGFITDDKITVVIRFWIANMKGIEYFPRIDFTDPTDPSHDVTLVIEGEKIYVNKAILAINSRVFKAMFHGNFSEKNKKEIELKDVDRQEFLEMLDVIYPSCKYIKESSAEFLIKLGEQFQIACVTDRAQKALIDSEHVSNINMLRIADKYKLFGLREHCLSELKTKQDFKDVKESPIFNEISDATKAILFSRLLEID